MKTDTQLQQDVIAELKWEPSGTVHSWSERDAARHSAWGMAGVRAEPSHRPSRIGAFKAQHA